MLISILILGNMNAEMFEDEFEDKKLPTDLEEITPSRMMHEKYFKKFKK